MHVIGRHTMLIGVKHSGKSNWLQWLLTDHDALRNHLMVDVCREHTELNRYVPKHRSGEKGRTEIAEVLRRFVTENDRGLRPDVIACEEVNRYAPNSGGTPDALLDLVDLNRHYGVGFIGVCRRPAQTDTNLIELADNLVVFRVRGPNDRKRLNNEVPGLGDEAAELDGFEYIVADRDRQLTHHEPVPEMDTTGEL